MQQQPMMNRFQQRYQPVGFVQSQYDQYQQRSYQMPQYRGNQPSHDQYLRSDSNQPNQPLM